MEIQVPYQLFMSYVCVRYRYGIRSFLTRQSWFTNPFSHPRTYPCKNPKVALRSPRPPDLGLALRLFLDISHRLAPISTKYLMKTPWHI